MYTYLEVPERLRDAPAPLLIGHPRGLKQTL